MSVLECFQTEDGRDYKGHVNVSYRGNDCLSWSDHAINLGITEHDFPDLTLEDASNYCRNPQSLKKRPWCLTSEGIEWCTVLSCERICSNTPYGFDYVGRLQWAHSGQPCIPWTTESLPFTNEEEFPGGDRNHSYCRNPARSQSRPWCYISETISQLCVVPRCPAAAGTFHMAEITDSVFYIAWLFTQASSSHQLVCYRLNNNADEPSELELYLQDLASYCDGPDRYVTAVCSWDAKLYEEHNAEWYHTVVDCGLQTTTAPPSSSQTSSTAPSSSQTSTTAPSSSQTSSTAPSSSQTSTTAPSSSQTSTTAPSFSQTSTTAPSSSQTSTTAPSSGQTSTTDSVGTKSSLSTQTSTLASPSSSFGAQPSGSPTTTTRTASTTQSAVVEPPSQKLCPCDCAWNPNAVYSDEQVQAMVDKINKELTVQKKNLSSAIRAKTSAEDNRQSAVSTGVAGLALIGLVGGLVLSMDFLGLLAYMRTPPVLNRNSPVKK